MDHSLLLQTMTSLGEQNPLREKKQLHVHRNGNLISKGWYLHDGVNRTRLLTEPTVDALGHVDVVASGSTTAVGSSLRLDRDGLVTPHTHTHTDFKLYGI